MAVPEQTPYKEYTANGSTTSFALGFICDSKNDLIVLVDGVTPPVATWSLIGANAVFTTAPASGKKIILQRQTKFERTTNFQGTNNSFRPETINKDIDRVWLKLQELGIADWLMKLYVDRLHREQKEYIDQKDDELKNYLIEEIRKQGVALDQLEDYYNRLMQKLAEIALEGGWTDSVVTTWSGRTQEQKNKDFLTAADWGMVADEVTDNKSKFANAIAHYQATGIRTYLPFNNGLAYKLDDSNYSSELLRKVFFGEGRIYQFGLTASDPNRYATRTLALNNPQYLSSEIDPNVDFTVSNSFAVGKFIRIGQSPNNAMQGFCYDLRTNEYFSYHVSTTVSGDSGVEYGVLNRYSAHEAELGVFQSVQSSTPQKITGHQGLSLAYDSSGNRWFFASAHSSDESAGAFIIKFQWDSSNNEIRNDTKIRVFNQSKRTSATTTPAVSPDGRYLAVKRNESPSSSETGQGAYRIRVFDLQKCLGLNSLNWENDYLYEFVTESFDLIGTTYSFQNLAVGFDTVTCLFGNSVRDDPVKLLHYTLDGRLISADLNCRIGMVEAHADDPASPYEPEAVCLSYYKGVPALFTFVTSGLSGARIARLMVSSSKLGKTGVERFNIPVGGVAESVDLSNNGYFLRGYRRGEQKLQLYTSASQTRITAHTGNLLALVVQNDNDASGAGNWEWRINNTGALYPSKDKAQSVGGSDRLLTSVFTEKVSYTATVFDSIGSGSPEGVLVAGVGSTYRNTSGGANTTFYVKESGTGNTGWVAK
ncbi:hypothetical protein Q8G42_00120 [Acinetobacter lwoffii]|uniref:Tail fiber protein n=1 Tax=Acinetobacter lwoffii TaxID=28090 RepID=A0AAW8AT01_ACILW|nr:hypothetical protein [Acinetobacter lwoffii]MDP1369195.1 hypothetical protein [Acinetobacter lwoffii]MDP1388649.1 hypothetical protein [Acinetobacter lwoffii]MDP1446361.1 hypothetical protein [Acinetobacter lwoffii]